MKGIPAGIRSTWPLLCLVVAALAGCSAPAGQVDVSSAVEATPVLERDPVAHVVHWNVTLPSHFHACAATCLTNERAWYEHVVDVGEPVQVDVRLEADWDTLSAVGGLPDRGLEVEVFVPAGPLLAAGNTVRAEGGAPLQIHGTIDTGLVEGEGIRIRLRWLWDEPVAVRPETTVHVAGTLAVVDGARTA